MKVRLDFVTNSSSSSFLVAMDHDPSKPLFDEATCDVAHRLDGLAWEMLINANERFAQLASHAGQVIRTAEELDSFWWSIYDESDYLDLDAFFAEFPEVRESSGYQEALKAIEERIPIYIMRFATYDPEFDILSEFANFENGGIYVISQVPDY